MLVSDDMAKQVSDQLRILKAENAELKEKLKTSIPRRRVRRVFKSLKNILEQDVKDDYAKYVDVLKTLANKIEKEGPQEVGEDVRQAIEHILGSYEINTKEE